MSLVNKVYIGQTIVFESIKDAGIDGLLIAVDDSDGSAYDFDANDAQSYHLEIYKAPHTVLVLTLTSEVSPSQVDRDDNALRVYSSNSDMSFARGEYWHHLYFKQTDDKKVTITKGAWLHV